MIDRPEKHILDFIRAGADSLIIHEEACCNFGKTLEQIKKSKVKCGISVKPGTSVSAIRGAAQNVDYILVMSVEPGFSGQKYIKGSEKKISEIKELLEENKNRQALIGVDGGINSKTSVKAVRAEPTS